MTSNELNSLSQDVELRDGSFGWLLVRSLAQGRPHLGTSVHVTAKQDHVQVEVGEELVLTTRDFFVVATTTLFTTFTVVISVPSNLVFSGWTIYGRSDVAKKNINKNNED